MTSPDVAQGVILFGHGSRDPQWHAPLQAVASRMREQSPHLHVSCAFLELTAPDLPTAAQAMVDAGAKRIRILPLFLGMGRHAREDLPRLVAETQGRFQNISIELRPAVGTDERLIGLLAELAIEDL
ncbi:MAG: cobalamin biosynthesis protein CbiX [Burkholderiales bacterium]|nr:MAG: cobalamin biosynthesis protein CbiX [Burkholderiales bacterium]